TDQFYCPMSAVERSRSCLPAALLGHHAERCDQSCVECPIERTGGERSCTCRLDRSVQTSVEVAERLVVGPVSRLHTGEDIGDEAWLFAARTARSLDVLRARRRLSRDSY